MHQTNDVFKFAKIMRKEGRDIEGGGCKKDKDGRLVVSEKDRGKLWKKHMEMMLLMLLFLIFYSPLACYNVYRFVASSLFSCCPIILSVIYAYYSCVDGTEIKDTN